MEREQEVITEIFRQVLKGKAPSIKEVKAHESSDDEQRNKKQSSARRHDDDMSLKCK